MSRAQPSPQTPSQGQPSGEVAGASTGELTADAACAAALAAVPGMNPSRLKALLATHSPVEAWAVLRDGLPVAPPTRRLVTDPSVLAELRAGALTVEPERLARRCQQQRIWVVWLGGPGYPPVLAVDRDPPPVLFGCGDPAALRARRVAMVGTRSATGAGRQMAAVLARELAEQGTTVVSGLARGIDGAVHDAVVRSAGPGRPLAVVASGIDVPYPWEHRALWAAVAERGLLLSEAAPGTRPDAWRFPLRNRIIAALAEVLVVVESRRSGGSLITVDEAMRRGITVMAVPGAVANPAAAGTNQLLREGAQIVTDSGDVLVALGLAGVGRGPVGPDGQQVLDLGAPRPLTIPEIGEEIWRSCLGAPQTLQQLVDGCAVPLPEVAALATALVERGWLTCAAGWYEARDGRS